MSSHLFKNIFVFCVSLEKFSCSGFVHLSLSLFLCILSFVAIVSGIFSLVLIFECQFHILLLY